MERIKFFLRMAAILLLILSADALVAGAGLWAGLRSPEQYEDRGVYTFVPYECLPTQVKNTSSGRTQRMNPTKTVYKVYYRDTEGAGYRWSVQASGKDSGRKTVEQGLPAERRVLGIPAEGTYITIDPTLTVQSYVGDLRRKYLLIMGAAGAYLLAWPLGWGAVLWAESRKKCRKRWEDWEESHD